MFKRIHWLLCPSCGASHSMVSCSECDGAIPISPAAIDWSNPSMCDKAKLAVSKIAGRFGRFRFPKFPWTVSVKRRQPTMDETLGGDTLPS